MTKKWKKSLAALLAMSMVLSMLSVSAFAAEDGCTFTWTRDPANVVDVTEGDQTVTVTLTGAYTYQGNEVDLNSNNVWEASLDINVDEALTIVSVTGADGLELEDKGNGHYERPKGNRTSSDVIATIEIAIPQDTQSGTYTLELSNISTLVIIGTSLMRYTQNASDDGTITIDVVNNSVREIPVESVTLDEEALELTEGNTATLTATVAPEDATDKTVTWSSDNMDVATVDENGLVTAVAEGTANITATAGEQSAACAVSVKAEEPEEPKPEKVYVAQVGETRYETLQAAIDAAQNGDTVTLLKDTTESVVVAKEQDITLNIPAGVTLSNEKSATGGDRSAIVNNGTLTVEGTGTVLSHCYYNAGVALRNNQGATVTLNGCTFINDNQSQAYYALQNFGTMNIHAPTVATATGEKPSVVENGWTNGAENTAKTEAMLYIDGGTFTGGWIALKNDDWGNAVIDGGIFSPSDGYSDEIQKFAVLNWNKLTINGGTFTNDDNESTIITGRMDTDYDVGETIITGGTFTNKYSGGETISLWYQYEGKTSVSGGTFSTEVFREYCAEGFVPKTNDDGTYTVRPKVSSILTTNIGTRTFRVGRSTEFTFTTTANDDAGIMVVGSSNFSNEDAITTLEYLAGDQWITYPRGEAFGPAEGFPMSDATSTFRVTFAQAGTYTFTASTYKVGTNEVLCSTEVTFTVNPRSTGGGGGSTTRPPEEDLQDEDTPLTDKPFLFEDVAETDWFYESVNYVFQNDLMKGTSETLFSPFMATDRAMIVTMLHRMEEEPGVNFLLTYPDVDEGRWYTEGIRWGTSEEIAKGYGDGSFGPTDKVTREQLAAFLFRYAEWKGYDVTGRDDLNNFGDVESVSDWALEAVQWAVSEGLLKGTDDGRLNPLGEASCSETAEVFARFAQAHAETEK